ncbi:MULTISPECIES: hypothetical protein [unclassified Pseudomonas]|uniref:hypothetical protein n=1 Tax=unclassified Pseudomonas TaxID=196821 RepID=UPI000D348F57|nr:MULTISPECIES: hypothetical protein [unclassified Pseudomonas]RAU46460.1 hypothetical protein DBP26_009825 [Pseudomonas sp. RIT 409]RAU52527.1 hypothetical protein DBY65_018025 [Pseudomonas sp. RIT 412]
MRQLNISARAVFWGWGMFDAIYIARYVFLSIAAGRIPYVSDLQNGLVLISDHGVYAKALAALSWGFEVSIILSCFLFLGRWRAALWLGWAQIPFRLVLVIPSVSIIFMGSDIVERYGVVLMLLLVVLSECLKGWTLWVARKHSL